MKKQTVLLCAALCLLCGCSTQQSNQQKQPDQQPQAQPPAQQTQQPQDEQSQEQPQEKQPKETPSRPQAGTVLSSFSTPLNDNTENRVHNIRLAIQSVNQKTLQPGEEFSFNQTVGRRTEERGYKKAKIIGHDKQVEEGLGGGICQLSSTLYNAAAEGGFPVTERHDHQIDPTYIKKGQDAAVAYGSQDFRFINNRSYPVAISCSVQNGKVTAALLVGK